MVITGFRRSRSGQAIVIMALAMVAICGILALAIDAGRLYFQRRLMQNAVDAGALAGAQDLVGTVSNPNGVPSNALYHGQQDTFSVFGLTAIGSPTDATYQQPSVTQTQGGYTVTTVAPSGYNNKQVQVSVSFNATGTFAQVLGFNAINIQATATAEAGTNAKTYAVFAYGGIGTGNTINAQMSGVGQVDNGQEGNDFCSFSTAGITISNAKFHIPTGTVGSLNINGRLFINSGSDNQNLNEYWYSAPAFGAGQDPKPNYLMPDTSQITVTNPSRSGKLTLGAGNTGSLGGLTLQNNTSASHDFYVYHPGRYTTNIVIPQSGDDVGSMYVFANGIYYFPSGASLQITGGHVSNTSTGMPHFVNGLGSSNLPAAADGTDGVEFVLDGSGYFSAANSALPGGTSGGASVFFVSPSFVPTGSTHIAFYVAPTNTAGTAWTNQNFDASASNLPRFQVWGTIFDASGGGGSVYLRAVQVGPHNLTPTDSDSSGQYLVNGEFIGFVMTLDSGSVLGNTAGTAPTCSGGTTVWTNRGTPGLLAQFNPAFAPAPGVNSYLVK